MAYTKKDKIKMMIDQKEKEDIETKELFNQEETIKKPTVTNSQVKRAKEAVEKSLDLFVAGKNQKPATMALFLCTLPPIDIQDVNQLYKRSEEYTNFCAYNDIPISNLAFYHALCIDKNIAKDWQLGKKGAKHTKFIKEVDGICATYRELQLSEGLLGERIGVFWQKNYDGLQDASNLNLSVGEVFSERTIEEVQDKYFDLLND